MSGVVVRSCSIVARRRNPRWTRGCNPSLHPQQRPQRPARAVFSSSFSSLRRQRGNYNHNNNNRNRIPPYVWMVGVASTGWVVWMVSRGLDSVPWTGRRRWIITSPQWEQQMGDAEYQNLLRKFRRDILPPTHRASVTVQRVGARIAQAAHEWTLEQQQSPPQQQPQQQPVAKAAESTDRPYTYTVVRSEMANAFVLPGNHVFVMTGLFRYVHNEDDLAAVLSHEAAHNLARHAGERVSSQFLTFLVVQLAWLVDPSGMVAMWMVPTASTLLRELPHSRQQETEADQIGVHLAARACFDPRAAPRVFRNMGNHNTGYDDDDDPTSLDDNENGGKHQQRFSPPEFLSTHPSHEHRIANFDQWLPEALDTYHHGGRCQLVRNAMEQARHMAAMEANQREGRRPQPQQ